MYGHFQGIKSRKKIRKETTSSRKERVEKVSNRISRSGKENLFPKINTTELERIKENIHNQHAKEQKKERTKNLVLVLLTACILFFLIKYYVYPFIYE